MLTRLGYHPLKVRFSKPPRLLPKALCCALLGVVLFCTHRLAASSVTSTTGTINFDSSYDGNVEMTLSASGLTIGDPISSTANLIVSGNALVSETLSIGESGSSNLNITGSIAFQIQTLGASTNLSRHNNSMIIAGSASDNLRIKLPNANEVTGVIYTIKKTEDQNVIHLLSEDLIDGYSSIALDEGSFGSVKLISTGEDWSMISSYEASTDLSADNLIGHWPLNESSGNIANNQVSNGDDGTLIDDFAFTGNSTAGPVGNALLFSGNRIELTNIVLDTNASIALWAKPISGSSDTYSFISSDSSGQNGINLGSNFATLYFKGNDSALVNGVRTSVSGQLPAGFDAEDWHHYCLVSDLSGLYGYVDGELVDSNTSGNAVIDVNGTMEIGHAKDHADRYMLGYLDDVRIYNKALSAAEVKALFNIQY